MRLLPPLVEQHQLVGLLPQMRIQLRNDVRARVGLFQLPMSGSRQIRDALA